jgi:signal transduction histidine kinase
VFVFAAPSSAAGVVGLTLGLLELALAVVALRHLFRYGRRFPWLALLGLFFVARGADRIYAVFASGEDVGVLLALDALAVAVLLLLLARLDVTVRGLQRAEEEADWNRSEYERALRDYRSLVRHRLANPLTVLRGGIETLAARDAELASTAREELVDVLRSELERLEATALEPSPIAPEEAELRPVPRRAPGAGAASSGAPTPSSGR